MNENLQKSLFLTLPAPIIGIGLIAPLLTHSSLLKNVLLGGIATAAILCTLSITALLRERTPVNGRIGMAILISAGILTIAALAAERFTLPVFSLFPLLIITAALGATTGAYDVKKKGTPILVDSLGLGISITALLCLSGVLCKTAVTGRIHGTDLGPHFPHMPVFDHAPGVLFIVAAIIAGIHGITAMRRGGRA